MTQLTLWKDDDAYLNTLVTLALASASPLAGLNASGPAYLETPDSPATECDSDESEVPYGGCDEVADPIPRDWQDEYAEMVGVPRYGEI